MKLVDLDYVDLVDALGDIYSVRSVFKLQPDGSDIRFVAQSDAKGYIVLPDVPAGKLSFSGSNATDGTSYSASGSAPLVRDTLIRLRLRGPADVLGNVPPISSRPLPASAPGL